MAAITPASIVDLGPRGAYRGLVLVFTAVSDGDTYTNTAISVADFQYQMTGNPTTQASAGNSVAYVAATGVFTFYPGEDGLGGRLEIEVG